MPERSCKYIYVNVHPRRSKEQKSCRLATNILPDEHPTIFYMSKKDLQHL